MHRGFVFIYSLIIFVVLIGGIRALTKKLIPLPEALCLWAWFISTHIWLITDNSGFSCNAVRNMCDLMFPFWAGQRG